jgi:antitoxin VapB
MQSAIEGQSNLTLSQLNEVSGEGREAELDEKYGRIQALLSEKQMDGVLLRRYENVAWLTAGQVESRVAIPTETGVAALLILRDGQRFYLAPENEGPRLAAEEFTGLGYEPVLTPWHQDPTSSETIARLAGSGRIGLDAGPNVIDLTILRAPLTATEVARFRWLSAATANVVESALQAFEPGDTEYEMEGEVARLLLAEGILPSVLLMAVDQRILNYKHAVARGAELKRFGMVNLCTRKWGLAASMTRFVHFGPMPAELARGFDVAAQVNAQLLHATRSGVTGAALYKVAADAYAAGGFPGEEKLHHQGGPAGYLEREWVATPEGQQVVATPQAFAWNPSCRGGKVEDTVLVSELGADVMTETPDLPIVETTVSDTSYRSAGVLIQG